MVLIVYTVVVLKQYMPMKHMILMRDKNVL